MQVDAPPEDNDNTEEDPYLVENPTLVSHVTSSLRRIYLMLVYNCLIYIDIHCSC